VTAAPTGAGRMPAAVGWFRSRTSSRRASSRDHR
jgi:hypothetical protein